MLCSSQFFKTSNQHVAKTTEQCLSNHEFMYKFFIWLEFPIKSSRIRDSQTLLSKLMLCVKLWWVLGIIQSWMLWEAMWLLGIPVLAFGHCCHTEKTCNWIYNNLLTLSSYHNNYELTIEWLTRSDISSMIIMRFSSQLIGILYGSPHLAFALGFIVII